MLDLVGGLIRNLVLLLFVVVFLELLMPQGQFNRYLRMVAGLLVILTIVTFIGTLLGRFPVENSLAALAERTGPTPEIRGTELWHLNRQQALQLYRDNLAETVRHIVAEEGGGQVSSVQLEIQTDANSPSYGAVLALEVTVDREAAPVKEERMTPVRVPPICIRPFGNEAGGEPDSAGTGAERFPALEKILSDRLQLPLPVITVRECL